MTAVYGVTRFEFDEENDLNNYTVWLADVGTARHRGGRFSLSRAGGGGPTAPSSGVLSGFVCPPPGAGMSGLSMVTPTPPLLRPLRRR